MDIAAARASTSAPGLNTAQFEQRKTHLVGWPPATFGSAPELRKPTSILSGSDNLYHLYKRRPYYTYRSDDVEVRMITKCPLLLCWAAEAVSVNGYEYLALPPTVDKKGVTTSTNWID